MRLGLIGIAGALALATASAALAQSESAAASTAGEQTALAPNSPPQQPAVSPATPPDAAAPGAAPPDFSLTFNVGAGSRYIFRGVDQTNARIQGFAGADLTYEALYAGTWISNVDFSPFGDTHTDAEIDLYGGYKKEVFGYALDVGFIYYGYAGQPKGVTVDYIEGYIKGTRAIGPLTLGASLFVSPDFTGSTGTGVYVEGNAAYTLSRKITLSGAIGHQSIEDLAGDYLTWNLGGTYAVTDNVGIDLRYYDTDQHGFGKPYGSKIVASIKANFP